MPRILIYGEGAREHAQAKLLLDQGHQVCVYPGNFGIEQAGISIVPNGNYDLHFVSMDADLVAGKVDELLAKGKTTFGPVQKAAMLEGSKIFCKKMLQGIPTANFKVISSADDIDQLVVLKFDGLAGGKGVFVPKSLEDLKEKARDWLAHRPFGEGSFFVEDFLSGWESSIFLASNGKTCSYIGSSQDYKRRLDDNLGPNTGGMGSVSPHPRERSDWQTRFEKIGNQILENLHKEGIEYRGFLYLGVMWVEDVPFILEINVRLGDPETQSLLKQFNGDFYQLLMNCAQGKYLPPIKFHEGCSVCIVGVQKDYPQKNWQALSFQGQFEKFLWAGVKDGQCAGRVVSVVEKADTKEKARELAYQKITLLKGLDYRHDIGI